MRRALLTAAAVLLGNSPVLAQQVNTGTNFGGASDSFSESIGTSWSVRGNGWFANFGGGLPGGAAAPFGGGLAGGFGFGGGGFSGNFGFLAQQGSSRSIGGTSGSITQMVGAPGYIFSGELRPFITEIRPIVGGGGGPLLPMSPLRQRLQQLNAGGGLPPAVRPPLRPVAPIVADDKADDEAFILGRRAAEERPAAPGGLAPSDSSAESGAESVAEIKGRQAVEDAAREELIASMVDEAERLKAAGELRAAANEFGRAAAKAEGERREALLRKARALRRNR